MDTRPSRPGIMTDTLDILAQTSPAQFTPARLARILMIAREGHFPSEATTMVLTDPEDNEPDPDPGHSTERQYQLDSVEQPANT
jgi:hypothetical protein